MGCTEIRDVELDVVIHFKGACISSVIFRHDKERGYLWFARARGRKGLVLPLVNNTNQVKFFKTTKGAVRDFVKKMKEGGR